MSNTQSNTENLVTALQVKEILSVHYPNRNLKAHVHSFGCQLNVADGERIRGMLTEMGYEMTDLPEEADLILYNTCAVRETAETHVYGMLGNIKHLKETNPNLIICLCGCMASEEKTTAYVKSHYSYVDIIFGTAALSRFPTLMAEHFRGKKFAFDTQEYDNLYEGITPSREHPFKASVPIMFGCNNFCTYCIVPYVRGRERSRAPQLILEEVRQLAQQGYKEIMLLGQNVNSYGKDLAEPWTFPQLLRACDEIEGDFVIRFMSSHPKDATTELMDTILNSKKIGMHFHLPVQCGSNEILRRMNRRYTVEQYLEKVDYIRGKDPNFSLTTDLIVGFPNETEEDFQGTLDLVERVGYDNIYTFIYSKRSGTKAAEMEDKITAEEKKDRMGRLLALQREIASKRNAQRVGQTLRVLVEGTSKREGWLTGKDRAFIICEFQGDPSFIGKFVNVKITESRNWAVIGEIVGGEEQ